jgi:YaiO family outer membrane protein
MNPLQINIHNDAAIRISILLLALLTSAAVHNAIASEPGAATSSENPSTDANNNYRREIEAGTSYESLTNGYPAWKSYYLDAVYQSDDMRIYHFNLKNVERSKIHDYQVTGGIYKRLNRQMAGVLELSFSATGRVLADRAIFGQIQTEIGNGTILHFGHRYRAYEHTNVNISSITLEKYYRDYRASYTLLKSSIPGSGLQTSHNLQLNKYYNDRSTVGLSLAVGKEVDLDLPSQNVLHFDTRSLAIIGRHWLDRSRAISYVFNIHRQGDSYTRRGLTVGIRRQF